MTTLEELDRRVTALEKAQRETAETQHWMSGTLGRIAAVQDDHTKRLDRIDGRLDRIEGRLDSVEGGLRRVEKKVDDLAASLPAIVAGAMREVLKER
jgi:chaperonin cofactor prefoldin